MPTTISEKVKSLEAVVVSLQNDLAGKRANPLDGLQNSLTSLLYDHIDDIEQQLGALANTVRESQHADEIKVQIDHLSSHIENGFRNLAEEIASTIQSANLDEDTARQEFQKQVGLMTHTNAEFLSAVTRLYDAPNVGRVPTKGELEPRVESASQSVEAEAQLKAQREEIERLKAALEKGSFEKQNGLVPPPTPSMQSPETEAKLQAQQEEIERLKAALALVPEDAGHWKKSAEQFEESLKLQMELAQNQEAALVAQHEEQSRLFTARYRALVEELATAKGNIRVLCRIKPDDAPEDELLNFTNPDDQPFLPWAKLRVTYQSESQRTEHRDFEFQRAFGSGESNQVVFDEVKDFAKSAAYGQTCTIMAYGATGTGKSYLFLSDDGLVFSYIRLLFQLADEESAQYQYEFHVSAIEIYLNKVYDLLQEPAGNQKIEVKLTAESSAKLDSEQDGISIVKQAIGRREAASTRQNSTSSRSHFIISIRILKKPLTNKGEKQTESFISLCDLAGSEAAGKNLLAGGTGSELLYEQAQDINQGLLDLGKGVRSVATKGKFFPSHNLTKALRSSLSPGARLLLVATVSSLVTNQNNTLTTLRWTQDAIGSSSGANPSTPVRSPLQLMGLSSSKSSKSSSKLPLKSAGGGSSRPSTPSSMSSLPVKQKTPSKPGNSKR
ncbi:P-loop containing nucleoside triphosphate hydrolase protein [Nemania diffusa]|nr:P-loop containing nucleoside triphosphate hydrolase protein [Nemania diffusa]